MGGIDVISSQKRGWSIRARALRGPRRGRGEGSGTEYQEQTGLLFFFISEAVLLLVGINFGCEQ